MRAITLFEPFASLIADGRKRYETRSWAPPAHLAGSTIAIHASRFRDKHLLEFAGELGFDPDALPFGCVVCRARLVGWHQLAQAADEQWVRCARSMGTDPDERIVDGKMAIRVDRFGDYSPGRWAWRLDNIERFDEPVPATGSQGFWRWKDAP